MAKKNKKPCRTNIGGQAVFEGVMMRGATSMATAVRDEDGVIRVETKRHSKAKKPFYTKVPILRGMVNFFMSMVSGIKTMMRSTEVFGGDEPSKFDNWLSKKLKIDVMTLVVYIGVILGLGLSIFLFILSPQWLTELIARFTNLATDSIAFNFIEGGLRIVIFICYILLASLSKDIKRTFQYHGAEHKTISCYEEGKPLTVENVRGCKRVHDRCGTTFLFFVMLVSILVFSVANSFLHVEGFLRSIIKILLLPLVAGLSYELLKLLSKTDFFLFFPLKLPGLLLQRITTKEPTDEMIEVAIVSFNKVLEMEADLSIEPQDFVTSLKICDLHKKVIEILQKGESFDNSDAEWITSICCGIKRSEIKDNIKFVKPSIVEKAISVANERISGKPLWYIFGDAEFYGRKFIVDESVLIPRPETEELVFYALKNVNEQSRVLDLCTGSGAIAVTVKLEAKCAVDAVDFSLEALKTAQKNAQLNGAEINFIHSNLFENIENKYNVIISNPPYVKTGEIEGLGKEISFEPKMAFDGGSDGLDFYRNIAKQAPSYLEKGGVLIMECGQGQASDIEKLLTEFKSVEIIKDLNGVDRIVKAELE